MSSKLNRALIVFVQCEYNNIIAQHVPRVKGHFSRVTCRYDILPFTFGPVRSGPTTCFGGEKSQAQCESKYWVLNFKTFSNSRRSGEAINGFTETYFVYFCIPATIYFSDRNTRPRPIIVDQKFLQNGTRNVLYGFSDVFQTLPSVGSNAVNMPNRIVDLAV